MKSTSRWLGLGLETIALMAIAHAAYAHPGHPGHGAGLAAGFLHPIFGPDHLLAALASGLLAVRIGTRRALWTVPLTFAGLMLTGGAIAALGVQLPKAEWGIAFSVIALGMMVALLPTVHLSWSALLVGLFALCHGHAHVAELGGNSPLPYMIGFALATLMIHAVAISAGLLATRVKQPQMIRFAGVGIAMCFLVVLAVG